MFLRGRTTYNIDSTLASIIGHNFLNGHMNRLCMSRLCRNESAIPLIEQNLDKIDWRMLSRNPMAIHLFEQNISKLSIYDLIRNPNAIHILVKHNIEGAIKSIIMNPSILSDYPQYINLIYTHLDKLNESDWQMMTRNPHMVNLLRQHIDKIYWRGLSSKSWAMSILERHLDKIDWNNFSLNEHPTAIRILGENIDKIYWRLLSRNQSAINILKLHTNLIDWDRLSTNQNAIDLLLCNIDKINWNNAIKLKQVSILINEYMKHNSVNYYDEYIIETGCLNPYQLSWAKISRSPFAIDILNKNKKYIHWWVLSKNSSAINLIEEHIDNVNWYYLCENKYICYLIKKYSHKVPWHKLNWDLLSLNKDLFKYDYVGLRRKILPYKHELIKKYKLTNANKGRATYDLINTYILRLKRKAFTHLYVGTRETYEDTEYIIDM